MKGEKKKMVEMTDKEKIEYLEEDLEDVFTNDQLKLIEKMVWHLLGLTHKSSDEEDEELRRALELLYIAAFSEDPGAMYAELEEE